MSYYDLANGGVRSRRYYGFGASDPEPVAPGQPPPDVIAQGVDAIAEYNATVVMGLKPGSKGYKANKAAFKLAYLKMQQGIDQLASNPVMKKIVAVGDATADLAKSATEIAQKYDSGKYKAGADGVVEASIDGVRFLEGALKVVQEAGVNSAAVREITSWANVGGGCAAGIAASPVWGAVSCTVSLLSKFLSLFSPREYPRAPTHKPRSILVLDPSLQPLVAQDAMRLARLLRRWYGVPSFASLIRKLPGSTSNQPFYWLVNNFPKAPLPGVGLEDPIPAHNLRTIVQMLGTYLDAPRAQSYTQNALALVAGYRSGLEPGGRPLYLRYDSDNDLNVQAIETGSFFARSAIAGTKHPVVKFQVAGQCQEDLYYSPLCPGGSLSHDTRRTADLVGFLRTDELLNFFAAVTIQELNRGDLYENKLVPLAFRFGDYNAVRLMTVHDAGREGHLPTAEQKGYSKECWTNLNRVTGTDLCDQISGMINQKDVAAIKELAAMRLMAAFSFLHTMWVWSSIAGEASRVDPIANLDVQPLADDLMELALPVDPRQACPAPGLSIGWVLRDLETVVVDTPHSTSNRFLLNQTSSYFDRGAIRFETLMLAVPALPTMQGSNVYRPAATHSVLLSRDIRDKEIAVRQGIETAQALGSARAPTDLSYQWAKQYNLQQELFSSQVQSRVDPLVFEVAPQTNGSSSAAPILLGAAAIAALALLK